MERRGGFDVDMNSPGLIGASVGQNGFEPAWMEGLMDGDLDSGGIHLRGRYSCCLSVAREDAAKGTVEGDGCAGWNGCSWRRPGWNTAA